jgi:hypothetical protein
MSIFDLVKDGNMNYLTLNMLYLYISLVPNVYTCRSHINRSTNVVEKYDAISVISVNMKSNIKP